MKTARFEVLNQAGAERIHAWIGDLDRALRARAFNGLVEPLAYQVLKGFAK